MATKNRRVAVKRTRAKKNTRSGNGQSLGAIIRADLAKPVIPGEILLASGEIDAFQRRDTKQLTVTNSADRPIQIGSHCHFFEVNRALRFDREQAYGFRLCIPAGTAARFEPGEEKRVTLVAFAGTRIVHGINNLTDGRLDDPEIRKQALARARDRGFMPQGRLR